MGLVGLPHCHGQAGMHWLTYGKSFGPTNERTSSEETNYNHFT